MTENEFNTLLFDAPINLEGVFFVGDLHGRFDDILDKLLTHKADAAVFLGDFFDKDFDSGVLEKLRRLFCEIQENEIQLRYIYGNHDHPSVETAYFFENEFSELNINAKVETIGRHGLRVAGLGGVFRGKVWYPKDELTDYRYYSSEELLRATPKNEFVNGGLPLRQRSTIMPNDYFSLNQFEADVLVSHEAPKYFDSGFVAMDHLASNLGAKLIVHGHHHLDQMASIANGKIAVRSLEIGQVWNWYTSRERIELELDMAFGNFEQTAD